jgi:hypothetical protein
MLFNLSQQTQFKNHRRGDEIFCYSERGPYYGIDELAAFEPFNGDGNCRSDANEDTYKIPLKDGKNTLTNKEDGFFTITELEVWEVTEMVSNNIIKFYLGRMITAIDRDRETENTASTYYRTNLSFTLF